MSRIAIVLVLSGAFACGAAPQHSQPKVQRTQLAPDQQGTYQKLLSEADALWEKRDDVASLKAALAKWEKAVQIKDDDWQTYAKLSRGYYLLADGTYQFDAMGGSYPYDVDGVTNTAANEQYLNAHLRGLEHAQRGMSALSPDFETRLASGSKVEDAAPLLGREGVPLIYWYATNLGKWAKAKGVSTVLRHKDRAFKMITFAYETAPDFYHAGPDRYFGAFYAVAPSFAGGDLNRSQQHFNASIKAAPNFLGTYVLAAELYATATQNRDIFERYLKTVIEMPENVIPEITPELKVEKRKAESLLKNKDELF
jgi:tetratricopeptide (TPR) repeat protein